MSKLNDFFFMKKLLVLGVLLGGLFFALSVSPPASGATACCSVCDEPYYECVAFCNAQYPNNSSLRFQCIRNECQPSWISCHDWQGDCDPGC
jgi:hypothetical protein